MGEQRRMCGPIVQETWDFSFQGLFTSPSLIVLLSIMWTSSNLELEILSHKCCGTLQICSDNLQISNRRKLGFTVWEDSRETGKETLPPAYNVSPCKILGFTYTQDDLQIDSLADRRHQLPLGGKTWRVKFQRKWIHGLLGLLFMACFWLAKSKFNVFIPFIQM